MTKFNINGPEFGEQSIISSESTPLQGGIALESILVDHIKDLERTASFENPISEKETQSESDKQLRTQENTYPDEKNREKGTRDESSIPRLLTLATPILQGEEPNLASINAARTLIALKRTEFNRHIEEELSSMDMGEPYTDLSNLEVGNRAQGVSPEVTKYRNKLSTVLEADQYLSELSTKSRASRN